MLVIPAQRLRELVPVRTAIDAVRDGFIAGSSGDIEQPSRLVLEGGQALAMLAADRRGIGTVLKAVTVRRQNAARGLPVVQAVVVWFDGDTGTPEALIDGTTLTALRTGAASGVATDLLAPPEAGVLAMIGAGGQAPDQVRAVCAVRPICEVRVASRNPAHAASLAARLAAELEPVRVVATSVAGAIAGADVVCTATTATEPLFAARDLAPTVHVNAVGAYTETMCELPAELLAGASVIAVDRVEAAMAEAGDLIQAIRRGLLRPDRLVEIGALLARPTAPPGGRTVFKSVGVAAQDWALARIAVERARAQGTGARSGQQGDQLSGQPE